MQEIDAHGEVTRAGAEQLLKAQFAKLDRNHDGVVSEGEFVAAGIDRFNAADTNGDGKVTRAELRGRFLARWFAGRPAAQP